MKLPFFFGDSKENRREYTKKDLPKTRKELVKLVLRDHFFDLPALNLVLLLVKLPLLFWTASGFAYIVQMLGADFSVQAFLSLGGVWVLIMIPCILLQGPFLAGAACVSRNIARDDCRFLKDSFLSAFKSNPKQSLAVSGLTSLLPILLWAACTVYLPEIAAGKLVFSVLLTLTVLVMVLWLLTLPTLYVLLVTYDLPLSRQIINAFALTAGHLPLAAGVGLLTLAPVLLGMAALTMGGILSTAVLWVLTVYYLLFGFALHKLLFAFLANHLAEEHINSQIEGADTRIGMRKD